MKGNMGIADRTVRFIIAVLLTVLYLTKVITGMLGIAAMVIALIFILTSVSNFCPIYKAFNVKRWEKTLKRDENESN